MTCYLFRSLQALRQWKAERSYDGAFAKSAPTERRRPKHQTLPAPPIASWIRTRASVLKATTPG